MLEDFLNILAHYKVLHHFIQHNLQEGNFTSTTINIVDKRYYRAYVYIGGLAVLQSLYIGGLAVLKVITYGISMTSKSKEIGAHS